MADLTFIEQIMGLVVIAGAGVMLFVRTLTRAMMGVVAFGAVLTAMILYSTMDVAPAGIGSLMASGLVIWPAACFVFFVAYMFGVFGRRLFRAIKPDDKAAGASA